MLVNADLTKPAVVRFSEGAWIPSPQRGVERRMLERDGEEVARATSIVRYAPGSAFSRHTHELGEEYIVLDGVFSDERGDGEAGTYVRNPPGSAHVPYSTSGCTIFVKLRQMTPADDRERIVRKVKPGESCVLYSSCSERVEVVALAPGTSIEWRKDAVRLEALVLSGTLQHEKFGALTKWDWFREGAPSAMTAKGNASLWVKSVLA